MVPGYINEEVVYNRNATSRILRNADFILAKCKKTSTQNTMWYKGLKLFNELESAIKRRESTE
jgi:hypothetical protein